MQFIKSFCLVLIYLSPVLLSAQTTFIPMGMKDYALIERLEVKSQRPELNFSHIKPLNRRMFTQQVEQIDSLIKKDADFAERFSKIDRYNMDRFLTNNAEWTSNSQWKKPQNIFHHFFSNKSNFVEVHNKDVYFQLSPLMTLEYGKEDGYNKMVFHSARGISVRAKLADKIGFDLYFTDNQERAPRYVQSWVNQHLAIPGAGYFKPLGVVEGYDYTEVRGSVNWKVTKMIDMQFGYDRNFIGNGLRSTFLSDFSNPELFLKINTKFWKLNYENLFMELTATNPYIPNGGKLMPKKYFRMNHISLNVFKWLNMGIFDAVMFGRADHFDFMYLNPILFLMPGQQQLGSPDNNMLGIDFKANLAKKIQLYGQLNFDEFYTKELFSSRNAWTSKYAYQLGLKYIDVLGIKNVDLQLESNRVRPFTYSHLDSVSSWTHYNQPLAHPLGSNFQEYIAVIKAQPLKRLYLNAKLMYYKQGLDSAGLNMGSNPLQLYTTRTRDNNWMVGSGNQANCFQIMLNASYEFAENFFLDISLNRRSFKTQLTGVTPDATIISTGLRWNMAKREFMF